MSTIRPLQPQKVRVLVIDDDREDFDLAKDFLKGKKVLFDLQWADSLKKGIESLAESEVDVVLLDLFLPDSFGLETLNRLISRHPNIPIVVLSGLDNEHSALEAVQKGAQDYLVKGQIEGKRLANVILYAMKRHDLQRDPQRTDLIDPLTGLYNRRGFITMADLHVKMAKRKNSKFFVCYAVLNALHKINDTFGKSEGTHALKLTAEILRESFRTSDVIARVGPNEFAIITSEQGGYSPKLFSSRIRNNKKFYNAQFSQYGLSLAMCANYVDLSHDQPTQGLNEMTDKIFADYRANQKN